MGSLQLLYLYNNQLDGEIPAELGGLTSLKFLILDNNQLGGEIPVELGNLTSLQELSLSRNSQLTGPLPVGLRHLSRLDRLLTGDTDLCAPRDAAFQSWLATIQFSGVNCPPEAQSVIDVAVFYTSLARIAEGGTDMIDAEIDLMIAETNQAYVDSGVNQRLSLVAREEVEYTTAGLARTDLDRLWNPSDGHMDGVHAVRDRVRADIVHLIVADLRNEQEEICGIAYIMEDVSNTFEHGAFSITDFECGSGFNSFAHETGHVMGLRHDRHSVCEGDSCPKGAYAYSYGYVNQRAFDDGAPGSARWRTIMAYKNQCSAAGFYCPPLFRFSNPNQIHPDPGGDPLGVPGLQKSSEVTGPSDAVRTLNRTRETVESFRSVLAVTVSFGAAAYTAAEGGDAATVTVRLSEAPGRPLAIPLKSMGATGASDDDYSGVPSAVAFASTDTATTFDVTAFNDTDDDDGETVELAFGELLPSGVTLGSPDAATVTLADNDESMGPGPKDTTAPTVSSITSGATHPTKDAFTVTISFSEEVTGLTAGGDRGQQRQGIELRGHGRKLHPRHRAERQHRRRRDDPGSGRRGGGRREPRQHRGERDLRGGHQGAGVPERDGGWRRADADLWGVAGQEFDADDGRFHGECGERRAHGFQRGDWRLHRDADARSGGGTRRYQHHGELQAGDKPDPGRGGQRRRGPHRPGGDQHHAAASGDNLLRRDGGNLPLQ